ncbi:MAG TPA: ferritin-like domain-containing protein [Sphingomicrobium sp.]|nr:ferritin-like domain-containing protein [Sphingomicrobium sp.]
MQISEWFSRRYIDLLGSIYIYNEHRGYTALDRVLEAVRARSPDNRAFIAAIEKHRADERKHYLMFRRWFERRRHMPLLVDRTCGHIDRFVEIMFGVKIDDMNTQAVIDDDRLFEKLCRVISLTEKRGFRQVEILLNHPIVRKDPGLVKIFRIVEQDEPSHWAPYDGWLRENGKRDPKWWERWIDAFIHSELLILKLPILFLSPRLRRRTQWADAQECAGARATAIAHSRITAAATLMTKAAADDMSFAAPMDGCRSG